MAGFKTHVSCSTLAGIAYGSAGHLLLGIPAPTAVVSAGLCGIAGMLPDVDSDSGKPVQEVMGFAAAVVPLLLLDHLRQQRFDHDTIVAAGIAAYVVVRFGLGGFLRKSTVHRGMWHSLPAVAIAAMATALFCFHDVSLHRWFKVGAVTLGYLVHLTLDEIYSVEWNRGRLRLKKSSGTAIKIWGQNLWANAFTFVSLSLLSYVLLNPPNQLMQPGPSEDLLPVFPREANSQLFDAGNSSFER